MAKSALTLIGIKAVQAKIAAIAIKTPLIAGAALFAEAQIEATESRKRTPVDTGALRASHEVSKPNTEIGAAFADIFVSISVGGAAAPYAASVHENLDAFHKVGQAKFLESTLLESAPHFPKRIAKRMKIAGFV